MIIISMKLNANQFDIISFVLRCSDAFVRYFFLEAIIVLKTHFFDSNSNTWTPDWFCHFFHIKLQWTVSTSHSLFHAGNLSGNTQGSIQSQYFFLSLQTFNSLHIAANKKRINKNTFVLACVMRTREHRDIFLFKKKTPHSL